MYVIRIQFVLSGIRSPSAGATEGLGSEEVEPPSDMSAAEREKLRNERHKERQRDRNIARAAPDKR